MPRQSSQNSSTGRKTGTRPGGKKNKRTKLLPDRVERFEIRISGAGGQGIISTGMLLGEAIALGDGRNVSQSQAYGPEARGGATRSDLIISDGDIFFPECHEPDLLVAFTTEAYEKHAPLVKTDGLIIADESAVDIVMGNARTVKAPFIKLAEKEFGHPIVANIIALGFLATYTGIVSEKSIREAVEDRFAGTKYFDMNLKALEEGFKLGREYAKKYPL